MTGAISRAGSFHFPPPHRGARDPHEPVHEIARGSALGSISMSCYSVGANLSSSSDGGAAASLPEDVPAENTNT